MSLRLADLHNTGQLWSGCTGGCQCRGRRWNDWMKDMKRCVRNQVNCKKGSVWTCVRK